MLDLARIDADTSYGLNGIVFHEASEVRDVDPGPLLRLQGEFQGQ